MKPLTIEQIKESWSKTYNAYGKPDWQHIFPYYHDDIIFQDVIQKVEGIEQFKKMCNRLTKRCKSLQMDLFSITKTNNVIMMDWKMTMSFRRMPTTAMFGATKLTLNEDGQIIEQRDYYDLWGDIFRRFGITRVFYNFIMKLFFG